MQISQTLWVLAPSQEVAISIAKNHSKSQVCSTYDRAIVLKKKLFDKGWDWPIWEMTFNIEIKCIGKRG
jgi:hypothetical protein